MRIDATFSISVHPTLPQPVFGKNCHSSAEFLARRILQEGHAPMWSAVRQVALILQCIEWIMQMHTDPSQCCEIAELLCLPHQWGSQMDNRSSSL